ncbi:MAG: hypothetical protein M1267_05165 [Candidatus Thermoplasmatota archaeon]|nr:hypothetical protein [Candidatus Thermoplasmatota archaeon]
MKRVALTINGNSILLIGGVRGLVSEGEEIDSILKDFDPEIVAISMSPEEMEGLKHFLDEPFRVGLSDYDIIYGYKLAVYGEVMVPPPIFLNAVRYASQNGKRLVSLDLPESEFSTSYTRNIGTISLIRHSLRKTRLRKKFFPDPDPDQFTISWQNEIEKIKGFRELQQSRIDAIAVSLNDLFGSCKDQRIAVIVEREIVSQIEALISVPASQKTA